MPDVTLTNPRYKRELTADLVDAPPVHRLYGLAMFRPDAICIEYRFDAGDWSAEQVAIFGPRRWKDGTDGLGRCENTYWPGGVGDSLPEWLQTLVTQHTPKDLP
jgi:hypothetical protein